MPPNKQLFYFSERIKIITPNFARNSQQRHSYRSTSAILAHAYAIEFVKIFLEDRSFRKALYKVKY